jgi:hypothetical protein
MSTTQRSDDATPEEKRARLRDAVHGGRPAPTSGATSSSAGTDGVDLRQLAREVERVRLEEEQRRLKAEADETEKRRHASARGGPCAYCGTTYSYVSIDGGPATGEWHTLTVGQVCARCSDDLDQAADAGDAIDSIGETRAIRIDNYHRCNIITQFVGTEITKFWYDQFLLPEAREAGFRWWYEVDGAVPAERRFEYLDDQRLRLLLDPSTRAAALPQPEPEPLLDGPPCPRCGCRHMWMVEPTPAAGSISPYAHASRVNGGPHVGGQSLVCVGCHHVKSLAELMSRLLGIKVMNEYGYAGYLGAFHPENLRGIEGIAALVTWYEALPDDDPRRTLTAAPFQYVGDLGELRRRAIDLWPSREHWRHQGLWQMLTDERNARTEQLRAG